MSAPPLPLRLVGLHATQRRDALSALATLPDAFRLSDRSDSAVVVGGSSDWPTRARTAAADGAPGVIALSPVVPDADLLDALTDLAVPLVLGTPWLHNAAITRAAPHFRRLAGRDVLLEARTTVAADELERAEADLLTTAAHLIDREIEATLLLRRPGTHLVRADATDGTRILVAAAAGPAGHGEAEFRIRCGPVCVEVRLPSASSARPARASVTDADGRMTFETTFVSTHRSSLIRLRDAITRGENLPDVRPYRAAITALRRGTPPPHR